jgi:uncharacterized membrane protein YagU involved in acid resistance
MHTLEVAPALPLAPRLRMPRLLLAGLTVGTLDLVFASAYWAQHGVPPTRILQAIAAWAIGDEAALAGGSSTVLLGALLHYAIMIAMAAGYAVAGRRFPQLLQRPLRHGAVYGAGLYLLMFEILVPLFSASPPIRPARPDWIAACVLAYVVLVGIPCALFARAAPQAR